MVALLSRTIVFLSLALISLSGRLVAVEIFGINGINAGANQFELVSIDSTSAATTSLGAINRDIRGIAFDAGGTLYGIDGDSGELVTIDPTNANVLSTSPLLGAGNPVTGLSYDNATGDLFGVRVTTNDLIQIDPGTASLVGSPISISPSTFSEGLAFDGGGGLFGVSANLAQLYEIDPLTGSSSLVGTDFGLAGMFGLVSDPTSGDLLGTNVTTNQLLSIDPNTAATSVIGSTTDGTVVFDDIRALAVNPVPSPTGASALLSLALDVAARRRRDR